MNFEHLSLSVASLIEVSSMLGIHLEDFAKVRNAQDEDFVSVIQEKSSYKLDHPDQKRHFYVSALDFVLDEGELGKKFNFIECNGSGFTGISNISISHLQKILHELESVAFYVEDKIPVVIIPCSGTREIKSSGRPSMVYEKLLFAQSIKNGLKERYGSAKMYNLYDLIDRESIQFDQPTVIIGYLMDLMNYLTCIDGKIHLLGQPVSGATHDRFCDNVVNTFVETIDIESFYSINNLFHFTSDKGNAYRLYNDFMVSKSAPFKMFKESINYERVFSRDELISTVSQKYFTERQKIVIKPHGAALGRGIEFFVTHNETQEDVIRKIDESIQATNRFCGVSGWAFPYTIVDFVDCSMIPLKEYPLCGHKFEMRVIVYREGDILKPFPSIVKISSRKYDPQTPDRLMLLNNVAAASGVTKIESTNYMLPLSNRETLNVIGISEEQLFELASFATNYVGYGINKLHNKKIDFKANYKKLELG